MPAFQNFRAPVPDLSPFGAAGVSYQIRYLKVQENISLRCITFTPPADKGFPPVVFLPGLASVMDNFRGVLRGLTGSFVVHYFETREKSSSLLNGKVDYSLHALREDLVSAVEYPGLTDQPYILMGYSLGATVILESMDHPSVCPAASVMVEPNASFPFPSWLLFLARYATFLYHPLKPFLKWYLRAFKTDMKNDRELYEQNRRILDAAEPRKISAVVRALAGYRISINPATRFPPTLVIGASKDRFHSLDHSTDIAASIPGSIYKDLETNHRSHSSEAAGAVIGFLKQLPENNN